MRTGGAWDPAAALDCVLERVELGSIHSPDAFDVVGHPFGRGRRPQLLAEAVAEVVPVGLGEVVEVGRGGVPGEQVRDLGGSQPGLDNDDQKAEGDAPDVRRDVVGALREQIERRDGVARVSRRRHRAGRASPAIA